MGRNCKSRMNKNLKTASIVAAGVVLSSISALAAEGGAKLYSLSAGLRGFYDDNIFTGNDKVDLDGDGRLDRRKFDSFGFEVTPGVRFSLPLEQTTLSAGYTYGLRYFADRPGRSYDQFHLADAEVNHRFNDNYSVVVADRFADAQEPAQALSSPGGTPGQLLRAEGNNINNVASVDFTAQLTPLWSAVLGYRNSYFNYDAELFKGLNRLENLPSLGLRYQWTPTTVVSANYQYGDINYSRYDARDSRAQYGFIGLDQSITARLVASVRVGGQMISWVNDDLAGRSSASNPYVDASMTYAYAEASNAQLGIRHGRNATDVIAALDQQSTAVYAAINHQITGDLRASLTGQLQNASFVGSKGSSVNDLGETLGSVGVTLNYRINPYLSAETSYFFDRLSSDILIRDFTRNRVFVGFRAVY